MTGSPMKATERQLKSLQRNQTRASIQEQMPEIPDAGKIIEKLEKRVDELETWKAGAEKRIQDLMAWMIREGGGK